MSTNYYLKFTIEKKDENKPFSLIVCFDKNYGIGLNNTIPWKLSSDLIRFRKLTTNSDPNKLNSIIMGRKHGILYQNDHYPIESILF